MELPDLPAPVLRALIDVAIAEDDWRGSMVSRCWM